MIDYKDILTNILNLSDFYHREKKEKGQYLLLEPIILYKVGNDPNIPNKELETYINFFFREKYDITSKIIDFYKSKNILNLIKENKSYTLNLNNENINNSFKRYNQLYNINYNKISDISIWFMQNMGSNIEKDINIAENIYNFLYDTLNNNIDVNNISDIYKNIANILNKCYVTNDDYQLIIKNILKGMVILKSIENYQKGINIQSKKPRIYLDNIFTTNLFGWCDETFYESSLLTLEILKELNFEICIHDITIDLILEYVNTAKKQQNNISINSLAYNIINPDYNNKNFIQVRNKELPTIKNDIFNKLKELGIKPISGFFFKNKEEDINLFNEIHQSREKINIEKGGQGDIKEKQTIYDFTIILLYKKIDITKGHNLYNMGNIFLTYQKAIINNMHFKSYDIYSPIMNVNMFINLLLLESIIANIQNVDKLINIVFINSYSNILHKEIINYINNIYSETKITEEERNELLSLTINKECQNLIIENESDPIKVLNAFEEYKKSLSDKVENMNNRLEDMNNKMNNIITFFIISVFIFIVIQIFREIFPSFDIITFLVKKLNLYKILSVIFIRICDIILSILLAKLINIVKSKLKK